MLSEGDKNWLQAFFGDIKGRLEKLEGDMDGMRRETAALTKSLDGFDKYVRAVLTAEHNDTDHAEAELAKAQEALREAELEQIAALENHERQTRGTGGE
jgi:hypothetical protein